MSWLQNWKYRQKITIPSTNVDEDLVNFPLMVPYGGESYRFTTANKTTLLDHVTWHETSHVKVPTTSASTDTIIYMYSGNDSALDASNAPSVLADYAVFGPLRNFVTGQQELASGLVMSTGGVVGTSAAGVNVNEGYVQFGVNNDDVLSLLDGSTGCTYSVAVRGMVTPALYDDYLMRDYDADFKLFWALRTSSTLVRYRPNSTEAEASVNGSASMSVNQHAAFTYQCYDGSIPTTLTNYNNGTVNGSDTTDSESMTLSHSMPHEPTRLGTFLTGMYRGFNANLSDFRVRKGATTTSWIKFENENLMGVGNGIEIGSKRVRVPIHLLGGSI